MWEFCTKIVSLWEFCNSISQVFPFIKWIRIKQYLHKDILIDLWLSRCQIQLEKMFGSINCSKNGMFQSNVSAAMVNVQRLWSFSSFNCCMMNSVMTAWLHDCCSLTRPGQGNTQTMLGGGRKAWSKTLQSTTREVSFSFSFPKSLSCDVVLPSHHHLQLHTAHNPFDVCDGGLGTDAFCDISLAEKMSAKNTSGDELEINEFCDTYNWIWRLL